MTEPWREYVEMAIDEQTGSGQEIVACMNVLWNTPEGRKNLIAAKAIHGKKIRITYGEDCRFNMRDAIITLNIPQLETMYLIKGQKKAANAEPLLAAKVIEAQAKSDTEAAKALDTQLNSIYSNIDMLHVLTHEFCHAADRNAKSVHDMLQPLLDNPTSAEAVCGVAAMLLHNCSNASTLLKKNIEEIWPGILSQVTAGTCDKNKLDAARASILDAANNLIEPPAVEGTNRMFEKRFNPHLRGNAIIPLRDDYDYKTQDPTPEDRKHTLSLEEIRALANKLRTLPPPEFPHACTPIIAQHTPPSPSSSNKTR